MVKSLVFDILNIQLSCSSRTIRGAGVTTVLLIIPSGKEDVPNLHARDYLLCLKNTIIVVHDRHMGHVM